MHDRQIRRFDLDDSDIRLFIRAHDFRLKLAAILELHIDAVRAFQHVAVRIDVAVGPHDESRAFALDRLRISRIPPGRIFIPGTLEKEVFERGVFARVVFLRDFNDHDARCDDLENFRKSAVQLMDDVLAGIRGRRRNGRIGAVSGWASGAAA